MKTNTSGFSLIEAIIYIALFTLIIGGAVMSSYQIFDGQFRIQTMARHESELNFVLRKLSWLSSGDIIVPNSGFNSGKLESYKGATLYTIELVDNRITMNGEPLSNLLDVSALNFSLSSGSPDVLTITMTVDDEVLQPITHYVRTD